MSDPSSQVAPPLLGHLHCLSKMQYAPVASINVEVIGDMLLKAPLTAQQYPFTWTMLDTPPEGSLFLVWVPPMLNGGCASDGFVWADPDQGYSMELPKGYTIEMVQTKSGFIPGQETHTLHTRRRYRLVAGPKQQGLDQSIPPPDPNLWLFHYIRADRQNQIPVANIPLGPNIGQTQNTRRHIANLLQQGAISQKAFFLHDRNTWPSVTFGLPPQMPAAKQPFTPQRHMSPLNTRAPGTPGYYSQPGQHGSPAANLPPSKRSKPSHASTQLTPAHMAQQAALSGAGVPGAMHDPPLTIDEEEDTSRGDMLDHLTPREISQVRYSQHHEWMEEVLGSVYPISKIKPIDLGLGLIGELEEMTKDLLDPPAFPISSANAASGQRKASKPGEGGEGEGNEAEDEDDSSVDPAVLEEFTQRAEKKIREIEEEMARMKSVHAQRLAKIKKTGIIKEAEKKLRTSIDFNMFGTEPGSEQSGLSALGADVTTPSSGARTSPAPAKNTMTDEEIVKMVEESLKKQIIQREVVIRWEAATGVEAQGNDFGPLDKDEEMGNTNVNPASSTSSTAPEENGSSPNDGGNAPVAEMGIVGKSSSPENGTIGSGSGSGADASRGGMEDVNMTNDEDTLMDEPSNFADAFDTRSMDDDDDGSKVATPQLAFPPSLSISSAPTTTSTLPAKPPAPSSEHATSASPAGTPAAAANTLSPNKSNESALPSPVRDIKSTSPVAPVPEVGSVPAPAGAVSYTGIPGLGDSA